MFSKLCGFCVVAIINGILAFFGWIVLSVLTSMAFAIFEVPLSIVLPAAEYGGVIRLIKFFISFEFIFSLLFVMMMLDDHGFSNVKTWFKKRLGKSRRQKSV